MVYDLEPCRRLYWSPSQNGKGGRRKLIDRSFSHAFSFLRPILKINLMINWICCTGNKKNDFSSEAMLIESVKFIYSVFIFSCTPNVYAWVIFLVDGWRYAVRVYLVRQDDWCCCHCGLRPTMRQTAAASGPNRPLRNTWLLLNTSISPWPLTTR